MQANIEHEQDSAVPCSPTCFVHECFHIPLLVRTVCECGEDAFDCLDNNHFLHHLSPKVLVDSVNAELSKGTKDYTSSKSVFSGY